ncbi:MAG TPA: urease accessory protein UreD [Kiritimatiellia bacterium]|nr:urease accessory protein UreD [Kiritimatiellia bacterium]
MRGAFKIECRLQPDGRSGIGYQEVSAPWHLSKPYWDGEVLLVQAVNATAGVFAGDHLAMEVRVEPGASVLLTSPSASRIHTMPQGEATLTQQISVADGAWLEWMPELFIPQRGCRYRQETTIDLAAGSSAYLVETLAPGRVAHGEAFAFERIAWRTHVRINDRLVLAEHYHLNPSDHSLADVRGTPPRYFANVMIASPHRLPVRDWQEAALAWSDPEVHTGITQPAPDLVLVRMLADSSDAMKNALARLRELVAGTLPKLRQSARKL